MSRVELDNVAKSYREGDRVRAVLSNCSGAIEPGAFVALTGASGTGKSTLLGLVAGMDRPDSGRVVVADTDLAALDETARTRFRRRHLGLVIQQFNLIDTLSVRENLLLRGALDGAAQRDAAEAERLLEAVGLADRGDARPDRLSGGEQQRVAIAAALIHQPALILADEPTGNLDRRNAETVLSLFVDLVRAHGATLLVATHDPAVAERADYRWELCDGALQVT
ncbi:MAG: ABC transporter ATP-binding protein [Planctomycetota bacterium]|jgi:putative ABC transport system ATP-binding protein|nr:ABC transporter ATP-binding protein [Planctomycetota bacterium]